MALARSGGIGVCPGPRLLALPGQEPQAVGLLRSARVGFRVDQDAGGKPPRLARSPRLPAPRCQLGGRRQLHRHLSVDFTPGGGTAPAPPPLPATPPLPGSIREIAPVP